MGKEDAEAIQFVARFGDRWPQYAKSLVHVANEYGNAARDGNGKLSGAFLGKLKKRRQMGVNPDAADYLLLIPQMFPLESQGCCIHGLALEMKAPEGPLKPGQLAWLTEMHANGYAAACAWGWQAALRIVGRYLDGTPLGDVWTFREVMASSPNVDVVPLDSLTLTGTPRKRRAA